MDFQDSMKVAGLALIGCLPMAAAKAAEMLRFSLPLVCNNASQSAPGDAPDCFVQSMMDMDSSSDQRDPLCGIATYDQHKGIDIRVRDLDAMNRGIAVLAMADGVVVGRRDGVIDRMMHSAADKERVRGRECGNGLKIAHQDADDGQLTTQYCHMLRGSVLPKVGDRIKRGQPIGKMGLSGATQFPHIHVSVRLNNKLVDPMTGGFLDQACGTSDYSNSLFTRPALEFLMNQAMRPLLDQGFAAGPVTGKALRQGKAEMPDSGGPLVYYVKFINLYKGDVIRMTVHGPKGVFARSETKPLVAIKATYTAYTGKRGQLAPGQYSGSAQLVRNGEVIFKSDAVVVGF